MILGVMVAILVVVLIIARIPGGTNRDNDEAANTQEPVEPASRADVEPAEHEDAEPVAQGRCFSKNAPLPQIAEITRIESCPETSDDRHDRLFYDFKTDQLSDSYMEPCGANEEIVNDISYDISYRKKGPCGRYMRFTYELPEQKQTFKGLRINLIDAHSNEPTRIDRNFSDYRYINFCLRFEKYADRIQVVLEDRNDNRWWKFEHQAVLEAHQWFHFKIPMNDLYCIAEECENHKANAAIQWEDITRFILAFEEPLNDENEVWIDHIYLSQK